MLKMPLRIFTESADFPFHIHYGFHDKACFLHYHEDFSELVIVLNGCADHLVEKETYPVSIGDVFVVNKYTEHGYANANDFRICNVMFKPEIMLENNSNIQKTAGFQALFVLEPHYSQNYHFQSQLRLNAEQFVGVHMLLEEMIQEYSDKEDGWQTLLYSDFIRLCAILSRLYQQCETEERQDILKLSAAIAHIEKNFCDNMSIAELAQISGYSERQFCRLFKATFAATPNLYITNLRMQKAQNLLRSTGLSIGEIAWNCGYEDQNYFSRIFKRYMGITPSEYQQKFLH